MSEIQVEKIRLTDIGPEDFYQNFFVSEKPVILTDVSNDWKAKSQWTAENIDEAKSKSKTPTKKGLLWFEADEDFLRDDYKTPELVKKVLDPQHSIFRPTHLRFWLQEKGHITPWHHDGNGLYIFNVHVKGFKEWTLVSPETPLVYHPFDFTAAPFSVYPQSPSIQWAKFVVEENEMLFLPPFWAHRVRSLGEKNVNLNWVGTKKHSFARNPLSLRELEVLRYLRTLKLNSLARKSVFRQMAMGPVALYLSNYAGGGFELIDQLTQDISIAQARMRASKEIEVYFRLKKIKVDDSNAYDKRHFETRDLTFLATEK